MDKRTSYCISSDVRYWNDFRPPGEAINAGEQVRVATRRWKRTYDINVNLVKAGCSIWECNQWCDCMPLNLGALAPETVASPLTNVGVDARPNVVWLLGIEWRECQGERVSEGTQTQHVGRLRVPKDGQHLLTCRTELSSRTLLGALTRV